MKKRTRNHLHDSLHSIHPLRVFNTDTGEWGDVIDPHFSWSPCECCGDSDGGNRFECEVLFTFECAGRKQTGKTEWNANCCPDCVEKWQ